MSPTPDAALLIADEPCVPAAPATPDALLRACAFGAADDGRPTVALLGDSHASHWRAALARVLDAKRWHGESLTRPSCRFSAPQAAPADQQARDCRRWNAEAVAWLQQHPEVHTVFTSAFAGAGVVPRPGLSHRETKARDAADGWARLPASVTRIVVLRDIPGHPARTRDCVENVIAKHLRSRGACALRRTGALLQDPLVIAARRDTTGRALVIDLSDFFCDRRRCYPVIGGVLTNKDDGHLTRAFARTLGPFLLSRVQRLGIEP